MQAMDEPLAKESLQSEEMNHETAAKPANSLSLGSEGLLRPSEPSTEALPKGEGILANSHGAGSVVPTVQTSQTGEPSKASSSDGKSHSGVLFGERPTAAQLLPIGSAREAEGQGLVVSVFDCQKEAAAKANGSLHKVQPAVQGRVKDDREASAVTIQEGAGKRKSAEMEGDGQTSRLGFADVSFRPASKDRALELDGSQRTKERPAPTGREGLASLFSKKGSIKNGSSKGATSLSDLIWQSKPPAPIGGSGIPAQQSPPAPTPPPSITAQPPEADVSGSADAATDADNPAPSAKEETAKRAETKEVQVAAKGEPQKGRGRAAKNVPKKEEAAPAPNARLRPDGTAKRAYVRKKKPADKEGDGKAPKAAGKRGAAGVTKPKHTAADARTRTRSQAAGVTAARGRAGRGRGRGRGRRGRGRGRWSNREDTPPSELDISGKSDSETDFDMGAEEEEEERCDELFGCADCHWSPEGCKACSTSTPVMRRPQHIRWKPEKGRPQVDIPVAPTFFPTEEEFADPLSYINKIRPEGERAGVACIVPPKGWAPPFALDKGTNGQAADSFRFSIRKQPTWQLSMRQANAKSSGRKSAAGRYDARLPEGKDQAHIDTDPDEMEGEFGFVTLDRTHTLTSFEAYAKWAKALHFGVPYQKVSEGENVSGQLRRVSPTVEEIEAEFWRIVETPEEVVESLYGQDLDSGHHGSGFPLPPSRKRLLEEHLKKTAAAESKDGEKPAAQPEDGASEGSDTHEEITYNPEEAAYSEHCWNINNLPRCKGSVLRYVIGDELITGVMVPWLYVGSCMSAFCWHIEDHALYSINYLHKGAPKVWYGVPATASDALDEAMRDAFPHLFKTSPDLLYQLVTMLSPSQLKQRGVPVHRLVHHEGSFVITFPNAYHAGFNTGFNCAEAVNFAPPDWLPWGCSILNKYRRDKKAATLSNDALLIALVKGAEAVQSAANRRASTGACKPATSPAQEEGTEGLAAMQAHRAASGKAASSSGRCAVPGQRADTSYLDPIKVEDAPAEAIRLAAAELALRVSEERRRREVGLGNCPDLKYERMTGKIGAKDSAGRHTNTEDLDCLVCKCDLWMTAITSASQPDKLFCPEHAQSMGTPAGDWVVLYRYTLEELDTMLETAQHCVPGTKEAIAAAFERKRNQQDTEVKKLGPLADLIPQPSGSLAELQRAESAPNKTRRQVPKQPRAKATGANVKQEDKTGITAEDLKQREDSGELSEYSLSRKKRQRKCRKEEEGDWIPPKKAGRGPGRKRIVAESAEPAVKSDDSEADVHDGALPDKAANAPAPQTDATPSTRPSEVTTDGTAVEALGGAAAKEPQETKSADATGEQAASKSGRGRGRGRGRSAGRGQTEGSSRGRGTGRGRGRGRGEHKGAAAEQPPQIVKSEPLPGTKAPQPVSQPSQDPVPQTVVGQVMGLDQHQVALWSDIQRIMTQTFPKPMPLPTGLIPEETQQLHERILSLQAMLQRQGVQTDLPLSTHQLWKNLFSTLSLPLGLPGTWSPVSTAAVTPPPIPQQGSPTQRSHPGNSVLMDILRSSVQPQPRGYVAQGSIPLSQSGGSSSPLMQEPAASPMPSVHSLPLFSHPASLPLTQTASPPAAQAPEIDAQQSPPHCQVDDDEITEQSEEGDVVMRTTEPSAAESRPLQGLQDQDPPPLTSYASLPKAEQQAVVQDHVPCSTGA